MSTLTKLGLHNFNGDLSVLLLFHNHRLVSNKFAFLIQETSRFIDPGPARPLRVGDFMRMLCLCLVIAATISPLPARSESPDGGFSRYVLAAVKMLGENRAAKGYGNAAFTQDLTFGDDGVLKASNAPITMCVAAQLEVLVEALNLYARETKDVSPFHYVPKVTWARLRPLDLRGQIWMVNGSPSTGAAHAFENFGMGKRIPFKDLFPGAFVNFNRTSTGHGVIFLGYIDKTGADLSGYSNSVAGFKYFSAQGMGKPDGGLGYRWGFFADAGCPTLAADKKRDCGIIRSENNNMLVGGYVQMPNKWDAERAAAQMLSNNVATDPALTTEGTLNEIFFSGITTDD